MLPHRAQLEPFLKTCGFRESAIQWLPAVGPSGDNLAKPPADPRLAAWWKGPTLAQVRAGGWDGAARWAGRGPWRGGAAGAGCATAMPLPACGRSARPSFTPISFFPARRQAIDNFRPTHRLLEKPLRMPVTDVLRRWAVAAWV